MTAAPPAAMERPALVAYAGWQRDHANPVKGRADRSYCLPVRGTFRCRLTFDGPLWPVGDGTLRVDCTRSRGWARPVWRYEDASLRWHVRIRGARLTISCHPRDW